MHGGWQGGRAWDALLGRLRADGHNVFAPTSRGLADGDTDRADLSRADLAAGLIQEILDRDLHDFVVTGHSGGGPVAQLVADRLGGGPGGRVHGIVFMSASC